MTPGQRLRAAAEMSDEVLTIAAAGIRQRNPAYTEEEVQAALAQLLVSRSPGPDGSHRGRRDSG